jgi:tetratricopeptide (TPR) repeat protein
MMLITIPLLVFVGIISFVLTARKTFREDGLKYAFLIFTILFPILFVIYEKSNLYGSWRHFLFTYPGIVVIAAAGLWRHFNRFNTRVRNILIFTVVLPLTFHPVKFMVMNHPYYYLYYNQLVGGLKGAYGNYETDYYYNSIREGSDWLISYLKKNNPQDSAKVGTNFPAEWFFRNDKKLTARYLPYSERSQYDWDYYIVANSYISPTSLKNKSWPPKNAIKVIEADGVPICAVLKRESRIDLSGYQLYKLGNLVEACKYFEEAVKKEDQDEIIFFNFAAALYDLGDKEKANAMLEKGLQINPESEPILMFRANILLERGETVSAAELYQKIILLNRKSFDAYPALAKIWIGQKEFRKARELLKSCLTMRPKFREAVAELANSYRATDPEVAKKYDELAKTCN